MREYGLRLTFENGTYRFATDRLTIEEGGVQRDYLPLINSFEEATFEISIDSSPSVPSFNVALWDAAREVVSDFESMDYEAVEATLFVVDDSEVIAQYESYMTDVEFREGLIEFVLRLDENMDAEDYTEVFEEDSFQYFQNFTATKSDILFNLYEEDCPWTIQTSEDAINPFSSANANAVLNFDEWSSIWSTDTAHIESGLSEDEDYVAVMDRSEGIFLPSNILSDSSSQPAPVNIDFQQWSDVENRVSLELAEKYVIVNGTTGAVAKCNGAFGYLPEDVEGDGLTALYIGHLPLEDGWDGGSFEPFFEDGDAVLLKMLPEESENAEGLMISRRATNVHSYKAGPDGDEVSGIKFRHSNNRYYQWTWDSDLNTFIPRPAPIFEYIYDDPAADPPQGQHTFAVIGSPSDEMQIVVRLGPDTSEDRLWGAVNNYVTKFDDGSFQTLIQFDDDPLQLTPEVKRFLDSKPVVRPIVNPGDSNWEMSKDIVYVRHHNYVPTEDGSDGKVSGFMSLGTTYKEDYFSSDVEVGVPVMEREIKEAYRFYGSTYYDMPGSPWNQGRGLNLVERGLLALEIHSHGESIPHQWSGSDVAPHEQGINIPGLNFDIPDKWDIDPAYGIDMMQPEWIMKSMDLALDNMLIEGFDIDSINSYPELISYSSSFVTAPQFFNRLRGLRFDMMLPLKDIVDEGFAMRAYENDRSDANERLLMQGSERFGVCTESEVLVDADGRWYERVYFSTPDQAGDVLKALSLDTHDPYRAEDGDDVKFVNELRVDTDFTTVEFSPMSSNLYENRKQRATNYFTSKVYRVIRDAVPEGGAELGNAFPIAYGFLEKVPLMHVIGNKVLSDSDHTAGDDLYVFAANRCGVDKPKDITLWLGDELDEEQEDEARHTLVDYLDSPIPKFVRGDHYILEQAEGVSRGRPKRIAGFLEDPYYEYQEVETREGVNLQAIRLSGRKWEPILGRLDLRYHIRHGLGSTTLYGSFKGQPDEDGDIIGQGLTLTHPVDVMRHFITRYGRYPFAANAIDVDAAERLKSKTRNYEASVFLQEPPRPDEFLTKMCEQFGFQWNLFNGKIVFSMIDFDDVNYSKPLMHNLNIGNKVEEVSEGYKDLYNRVVYRYRKDWMEDDWGHIIELDGTNNKYCRDVKKARSAKSPIEIDAEFVNSSAVARDVTNRIAKLNCSRRVIYRVVARYVDDINFRPGEIVPMTYPPYGIFEEPVLVRSVTPGRANAELEVIRFPNIYKAPDPFSDFEPSSADGCPSFVDLSEN